MNSTNMCWGFECGDRWFNLLNLLCKQIQHRVDTEYQHGIAIEQVVATQVKEKFGTLRFYYDGGDDTIRQLVDEAEQDSATVCDVCREPRLIRQHNS